MKQQTKERRVIIENIIEKIFLVLLLIIFISFIIFLMLVDNDMITSKEICKTEFVSRLDDIRYLDQGKAIFVFNDTLIISYIPSNLFKKGENMNVSLCYKQGAIGKLIEDIFFKGNMNKSIYYKVE